MVVFYWRTSHPFRADGTGGGARLTRRIPSRQWSQRISLVWHNDLWRRIVGRLLGVSNESTPIGSECEDRPVDALFEMQGFYDGRASLYAGKSAPLCPLFELRVLDRPC